MDAKTVHVVTKELARQMDWATVREAAKLAALTAVKSTSWWLCGRGLHIWETWDYEDGTVVEECACCQMQAVVSQAA
ncbi:MAG TPA: hypothetical protein VIL10_06145 [Marmoricola sp.]|jgi:hypothetical protein